MCGFGTLFHDSSDGVDLKEAGCRSHSCDLCGPKRRARQEIVARRGRPVRFLTLTCKPSVGMSPLHRRQMMGKAFPILIKRMQRELGHKVEYYLAVEETKRGEPHFHVLLRCGFIDQKLLSQWWEELTGAFKVDIRRVWSKSYLKSYIHKYVGKALHQFGKHKRYWMSRGWVLPPGDDEKVKVYIPRKCGWSLDSIDEMERTYAQQGWWRVPGEVEPGWRRLIWRLSPFRSPPPSPYIGRANV